MAAVILQTGRLTELQRSVRDYLEEGGSITSVLLVIAAIAGVVALTVWLTRRQDYRAAKRARANDPQRLFRDLLQGLALGPSQRRFLDTLAKELELKQPSVILLSSSHYRRCVDEWRASRRSAGSDIGPHADETLVAETRDVLFPPA
jgi:hypothetical protein